MEMGCYGIGVTRMLGAAIEQNHDDKGIVWPDCNRAVCGRDLPDRLRHRSRCARPPTRLYEELAVGGRRRAARRPRRAARRDVRGHGTDRRPAPDHRRRARPEGRQGRVRQIGARLQTTHVPVGEMLRFIRGARSWRAPARCTAGMTLSRSPAWSRDRAALARHCGHCLRRVPARRSVRAAGRCGAQRAGRADRRRAPPARRFDKTRSAWRTWRGSARCRSGCANARPTTLTRRRIPRRRWTTRRRAPGSTGSWCSA